MALPRYQNIGVQAGGGVSGINFPSPGETTRGLDTIGAAINTMSEAFFKEARIAATEEGAAYGAEVAPSQEQIRQAIETGTPIQPVGDARTVFGRAARETSARIAAIGVEAQAKLDMGKIQAGIKSGSISPGDVIPQVNSLTQGYSNALKQFDPVMARKLEAELAKDGNTLFLAASARAASEAAAAAKRDIETTAGAKLDIIPSIIQGGDVTFVDPETGNTINRSITDRVGVERRVFEQTISGLKPAEREKYLNEWDKRTTLGVQLYVAESIQNGNVEDAKRRLVSKEFDPLLERNPLLKFKLLNDIDNYEASVKREEAAALRVEASKFKDLAANARAALLDGRDVDLSWYSKERSAKLLGADAEKIDRDLDAAMRFGALRTKVAMMSPQEEAAASADVRRAIPPGTEGYVQRREEAEAFDRAIAAKRQAISRDPASYVLQSPQVQQTYNDMVAVFNDQTKGADVRKAAVDRYVASSLDMQKYLGVADPDRTLLPASQLNRLVGTFNTLTNSGETIAKVIQGEAAFWGEHWPIVERQLLAEKVPQEVGVVANLVSFGQSAAAEELSLALQSGAKKDMDSYVSTIPDANKDIKATVSKNMEAFRKSLQGASSGPDSYNAYSTAAETLAKRYMFTKGASAKDAATQAVKDIISQSYDFVSTGPDTVRVPRQNKEGAALERGKTMGTIFATDDLVRGLNHIRSNLEDQPIAQFPSAGNVTPQEAQRQAISSLKTTGRFVTNNDETGVYLLDASGKLVRDKDGAALNFTWAQLVDFGAMRRQAIEGNRRGIAVPPSPTMPRR